MGKPLSRRVMTMLACLALGCAESQQRQGQASVNPDAQLLQDFQARISKYMDLHKRLERESPPLRETTEPAKIEASQVVLAHQIRNARSEAQPGDIFTPEIRSLFRRLMSPELKGAEGKETKAMIKQDAPAAGSVPFKVNAKYPEAQPLPSMPPTLLAALPKLPEDLEYRIIGTHLILLDVHAGIIVDFIPNGIRP